MSTSLELHTDTLDETTVEMLGDSIRYTAAIDGIEYRRKVWADHRTQRTGPSVGVMVGDCFIEIRKVDLPAKPSGQDEVFLPRKGEAGETFNPKQVDEDESGNWWIVALKKKPA